MSSSVLESAVIDVPLDRCWELIRPCDFSFLNVVKDSRIEGNDSWGTVGSVRSISYMDGTVQRLKLDELSDLHHYVTFSMISSDPAASVMSVIHTIRCRPVTENNTCFVQYLSEFSNDVSPAVLEDSRYKKVDFFAALRRAATSAWNQMLQQKSKRQSISRPTATAASGQRAGIMSSGGISSPAIQPGTSGQQREQPPVMSLQYQQPLSSASYSRQTESSASPSEGRDIPISMATTPTAPKSIPVSHEPLPLSQQQRVEPLKQQQQRFEPLAQQQQRVEPLTQQQQRVEPLAQQQQQREQPRDRTLEASPLQQQQEVPSFSRGGSRPIIDVSAPRQALQQPVVEGSPDSKHAPSPRHTPQTVQQQQQQDIPISSSESAFNVPIQQRSFPHVLLRGAPMGMGEQPQHYSPKIERRASFTKTKHDVEDSLSSQAQHKHTSSYLESLDLSQLQWLSLKKADELWSEFDRNHDGRLATDEAVHLCEALIQRMAEEENEVIHAVNKMFVHPDEITSTWDPNTAVRRDWTQELIGDLRKKEAPLAMELIGRLDANRDGYVSKGEFESIFPRFLKEKTFSMIRSSFR